MRKPIVSILRIISTAILAGLFVSSFGLRSSAHERPLGDGKISSAPQQGYLMSCQMRFNPNAPGASITGPWLRGSTYDPGKKPRVEGSVRWPSEISVTREGNTRTVRANNLPDHPTGIFPITPSDPAYRYAHNPNRIGPQDIILILPAEPIPAAAPSCVPMGMAGFALTGTAIYNAVDARGRDAPAYEIQDACNGHPQQADQYHYHDRSPCLHDVRSQPNGHSDLVGFALDGFGIYGIYGEGGELLTTSDLDACHGHSHDVVWDGNRKTIYHYHMTDEYPYTIGCFRGTPVRTRALFHGGPPLQGGTRPPRHPPGFPPPPGN